MMETRGVPTAKRTVSFIRGVWRRTAPFQGPGLGVVAAVALFSLALWALGPAPWAWLRNHESANRETAAFGLLVLAFAFLVPSLWIYAGRRNIAKQGAEKADMPLPAAITLTICIFFLVSGCGVFLSWVVLGQPEVKFPEDLSAGQVEKILTRIFSLAAVLSAIVLLVTSYRKQQGSEKSEVREEVRHFSELFSTAVEQLSNEHPTVRLAGAQHLALLADSAPSKRYKQNCVDQLCSYLRTPHEDLATWKGGQSDEEGGEGTGVAMARIRAAHEVNLTIIRLIRNHCQQHLADSSSWRDLNFDLTGAVFHGADFSGSVFQGRVVFRAARFVSGAVSFKKARFEHADEESTGADFSSAFFDCEKLDFDGAHSHGHLKFSRADFHSGVHQLTGLKFPNSTQSQTCLNLREAVFSGGEVTITLPGNKSTELRMDDCTVIGSVLVLEGGPTDDRVKAHGLALRSGTIALSPPAEDQTDPQWIRNIIQNRPEVERTAYTDRIEYSVAPGKESKTT